MALEVLTPSFGAASCLPIASSSFQLSAGQGLAGRGGLAAGPGVSRGSGPGFLPALSGPASAWASPSATRRPSPPGAVAGSGDPDTEVTWIIGGSPHRATPSARPEAWVLCIEADVILTQRLHECR